jgi:hypothetical protein
MVFFKATDLLRLLERYNTLKTRNKFDLLKIDSPEVTRLRDLYRKLEAEKEDAKDILLEVLGVLLNHSNWYWMDRAELIESFSKKYKDPNVHALLPFDPITKKALNSLVEAVRKAQRESQKFHSDSSQRLQGPSAGVERQPSVLAPAEKSVSIVLVPSNGCVRFFKNLFRLRNEQTRPLLESRSHRQSTNPLRN